MADEPISVLQTLDERQRNLLAELTLEVYFQDPITTYKEYRNILADLISDDQTDTQDFRDVSDKMTYLETLPKLIEDLANKVLPTVKEQLLGLEPQMTEEYQDLVNWAKSKGKSERDLHVWLANTAVEQIRDMTRKEMVEMLVDGVKYDRKYFMNWWSDLSEEERDSQMEYIADAWEVGR